MEAVTKCVILSVLFVSVKTAISIEQEDVVKCHDLVRKPSAVHTCLCVRVKVMHAVSVDCMHILCVLPPVCVSVCGCNCHSIAFNFHTLWRFHSFSSLVRTYNCYQATYPDHFRRSLSQRQKLRQTRGQALTHTHVQTHT